jgi:predicted TIM-barrel fold metal-dependent hydrolase
MGKYGVAKALTYSLKGVMYDFVEGNDETLEVTSKNPQLLPVATVDPRRYIGVVEEVNKRREQGFVGLKVFPDSQHWRLDSVLFHPIVCELERLKMPLMVECLSAGSPSQLLRAVEGTTFPVIMCGIGYANLAEAIAACIERPELYIETRIIDPPDALAVAVEAVGPDRFVFGSNSPSCSMRASLNLVAESELSEEHKQMVFAGNLCRILGVPVPTDTALELGSPFGGIPVIDVHAHYGKWPFPMSNTGVGYTLELMKRRGIEKAILSSSYAIVYDFVEGNRKLSEAIEGYHQLLGYVTVNPNYFEASCRELDTYLRKPNFVGVKIHPMYAHQPADSPDTRRLVRKVAEYGRPLLIHTFGPGAPYSVLRLALDCPDLPIIMGHGGADAWREAVDVMRQADNLYMEFCCTIHEAGKVRRTIDAVGADRILFGSDLDLLHPGFIAGVYEEADLTPDEMHKILFENASRLFNIQP